MAYAIYDNYKMMFIVILFILGCVLFYLNDVHNSKVKHLKRKVEQMRKEQEREKSRADYFAQRNEIKQTDNSAATPLDEIEFFENNHNNFTSIEQFNDAINEIVKDAKYSPLERIYYESELTDQIHDKIPLKQKIQNHLDFLERRGLMQIDISAAKEIVNRSAPLGKELGFEEFIMYTIQNKGEALTAEIFPGLVKIFEVAGYDTSDAKIVYDKLLKH